MIDLTKFSKEEALELHSIVQSNVEKSDLAHKYYLFTTDDKEKANVFILCCRFLNNAYNLIGDGSVKDAVKTELTLIKDRYLEILEVQRQIKETKILAFRLERTLFDLLNKDTLVNDLVDLFSVLVERETINSMAKLKGISLEGTSGKEFTKIFANKDKPIEIGLNNPLEEDEFEEPEDSEDEDLKKEIEKEVD